MREVRSQPSRVRLAASDVFEYWPRLSTHRSRFVLSSDEAQSFLRLFGVFLQLYDRVSSGAEGVVEDDLVLFWHCRETHRDVVAHRVSFKVCARSRKAGLSIAIESVDDVAARVQVAQHGGIVEHHAIVGRTA